MPASKKPTEYTPTEKKAHLRALKRRSGPSAQRRKARRAAKQKDV